MGIFYTGQHRDSTPRPTCTCHATDTRTRLAGGAMHDEKCAIVVEMDNRLLRGVGGTR